jgi:hydrogenase maturation protease
MDSSTDTQPAQTSVLIVAYGNLSRRDDGVAFHVVRRLRERLGLSAPESAPGEAVEDDYAVWNGRLAVACMHQLAPEMAEMLSERDVVVFVDAHVPEVGWEPVEWREVIPAYHSGMVSHHLKPDAVLALCHSLYGRCPQGYVLSVVGTDFDFGETLSPSTAALVEEAVGRLLGLLNTRQGKS